MRPTFTFTFAAAMLVAGHAIAESGPATLPSASEPLEQACDRAPFEPLGYEFSPRRAVEVPPSSHAALMATGDSIVICFRAETPGPPLATAARHDAFLDADDHVTLSIATAGGGQTYVFKINAVGATRDHIASSQGLANTNWTGRWSAVASSSQTGYSIRVTIPLSTLGMRREGNHDVSVNVTQANARGRREVVSLARVDASLRCLECQYRPITITVQPRAESAGGFTFLPYALAISQTESGSDDPHDRVTEFDIGADVQYARGDHRGLLTINPDFSQVEGDSIVLDINRRFAISYPERRPFFTETSGAYGTPLGLLYTRTLIDPSVGGQYLFSDGDETFAVMLVADEFTRLRQLTSTSSTDVTRDVRSWNAVARGTHRVGENRTRLGWFASARTADGYSNAVGALDGRWDLLDRHQITAQVAGSQGTYTSPITGERFDVTGAAATATHQYRAGPYVGTTNVQWISSDFSADLSSGHRVGTRSGTHNSVFEWAGKGVVAEWFIGASTDVVDDGHGTVLDGSASAQAGVRLANQSELGVVVRRQETLEEEIRLSARVFGVSYGMQVSDPLSVYVTADQGDGFDYVNATGGTLKAYSAGVILSGAKWIEMSVDATSQRFESDFPNAGYSFDALTLRGTVHWKDAHHFALFATAGRLNNFLNVATTSPSRSRTARAQATYTYEMGKFSRLIVGTSARARQRSTENQLALESQLGFVKIIYDF